MLQPLAHFNSIKVRLELVQRGFDEHERLFQFHKGTIRTRNLEATRPHKDEFQFHKGTIRTRSGCPFSPALLQFQFHKGTIRTIYRVTTKQYSINFNSIKVRLELTYFLTFKGL